jgi:DNA-binding MarR family transcriptional regulator
MKQSVEGYLNLLNRVDDAARQLGLAGLSESDRAVAVILWSHRDKQTSHCHIGYDEFAQLAKHRELSISRAQYFKSINQLEQHELIRRVNGERSAHYLFLIHPEQE